MFTGDGVGGSGDFLMAALHRTGFANIPTSQRSDDGLALRDAFIAAAVRCAPPDNKPTPEEIANCLPHLDAELAALPRVRVVVALGRIAFDAYLQLLKRRGIVVRPRPQFAHGVDRPPAERPDADRLLPPEPPEHEHRQAHRADDERRVPTRRAGTFAERRCPTQQTDIARMSMPGLKAGPTTANVVVGPPF